MQSEKDKGDTTLLLAHGAGAGMNSPFLEAIAKGLSTKGIRVVRFNFPYMEQMLKTGKRRPPNTSKILISTFQDKINKIDGPIFIGGKSMGGRIATMIADTSRASGVICLGYPFHPPGKPEKLRTEHLKSIQTPTLILQGERDPFGKPSEVESYGLSSTIVVKWLPDGDHSLKPRKKSGFTHQNNINQAILYASEFMKQHR